MVLHDGRAAWPEYDRTCLTCSSNVIEGLGFLEADMAAGSENEERSSAELAGPSPTINFTTGNPQGNLVRGKLQLSSGLRRALRLTILKVPTYMTAADLCHFLALYESKIRCLWLLRDVEERNSYDVLLSFNDETSLTEFAAEYEGKVFSTLGPDRCRLFAATSVTVEGEHSEPKDSSPQDSEKCPICLDVLETGGVSCNSTASLFDNSNTSTSSSGPGGLRNKDSDSAAGEMRSLIVTLCGHSMHIHCLAQWGDNSCPVCRFGLEPSPESSTCQECEVSDSLWMCLICGHVGCGRRVQQHALLHFKKTSHTFSVEIESGKVWDYVGDNFVHRLIASSSEDKIVEVSRNDSTSSVSSQAVAEVHTAHQSLVESVVDSYNRQVTDELDRQRLHYEKQIKEMDRERERRIGKLQEDLKNETELRRKAQELNCKSTKTVEKLRISCAEVEARLKELRKRNTAFKRLQNKVEQGNDNRRTQLEELEQKISKYDSEAILLKEQIRDISLHLNTLDTLVASTADGDSAGEPSSGPSQMGKINSEIAGAAVVGIAPATRRKLRNKRS
uniref:UBP-type domain-containing protein n=1 Tax=Rhodosorus marinus TaxID=101924 RepID=A0A7S3E5P1_9RHOD|mmetsp:Transcript_10928/g.45449  ORF Transcript_10928/g.45449 Transcript_10928/m.45449 type:complete len:560 (+) Transcript_10928:468-2147(+)